MLGLGALAGNFGYRTQISSSSAALAVVFVVAAVLLEAPAEQRRSSVVRAAAVTAIGAATLLPLRASTWLAALNSATVAAALGVLVLGIGGMQFSASSTTIEQTVRRTAWSGFGPLLLWRSARPVVSGDFDRIAPVVRGLAVAAVPLLILGALLAEADAAFASVLTPDIDAAPVLSHLVLTGVLATGIAGLIAIISADPEHRDPWRPLGAVEAIVVLGSIAGLFGAFAAVQLASALGQTDDLLAAEGVSHAEYARSGYFQLLWVAALTIGFLVAVWAFRQRGADRLETLTRMIATFVALLTVVIVASAIVRLDLYTDEFGQTTLRWYSDAFAWILGAGFVGGAALIAARRERLLAPLAAALLIAALGIVNALNPEARIAEHNLERAGPEVELDGRYLVRLSADAWPVLLQHEERIIASISLDGSRRLADGCERADRSVGFGLLGYNVSRARLDCNP
ncbi:MAG: DUF4173 domain-containing protein [Actinomycetota bacterium]